MTEEKKKVLTNAEKVAEQIAGVKASTAAQIAAEEAEIRAMTEEDRERLAGPLKRLRIRRASEKKMEARAVITERKFKVHLGAKCVLIKATNKKEALRRVKGSTKAFAVDDKYELPKGK